MKKWLTLTAAAVLSVSGFAQEVDEDLQARIEAARQKLDEAAREFAELQREAAPAVFDVHAAVVGERRDRPFLGLFIGRTDANGITLGGVTPGGPADAAGLKAGDQIISIDGVSLAGFDAPFLRFNQALENVEAGQPVRLDVVRDDSVITVDVVAEAPGERNFTIRSLPAQAVGAPQPPAVGGHGITQARWVAAPGMMMGNRLFGGLQLVDIEAPLGDYFGVGEGVLVLHAGEDSGLQAGDILQSINDEPVDSAADAYQALANLEAEAYAAVVRQRGFSTVRVQPMTAGNRYIHIEPGPDGVEHHEEVNIVVDAP
jgi:S1-C subfamily serine protease